MSASREMKLENATDQALYFIIYQHFPIYGLNTVVWKVRGLPPRHESSRPSSKSISWNLSYGVALSSYNPESQVYSIITNVQADLGNKYKVSQNQGIPDIPGKAIGPSQEGSIILLNKTADPSVHWFYARWCSERS